jgi:hypothetical protein
VDGGDSILNLLGMTMWVGAIVMAGSVGAILLAVVRLVTGMGLASTRFIPPAGVGQHAEAVRARLRMRYMVRAARLGDAVLLDHEPEPDAVAPFWEPEPIAVIAAQRAAMPITSLPPLNESLRRGLASRTRVAAAKRPAPRRRRSRRNRGRVPTAA